MAMPRDGDRENVKTERKRKLIAQRLRLIGNSLQSQLEKLPPLLESDWKYLSKAEADDLVEKVRRDTLGMRRGRHIRRIPKTPACKQRCQLIIRAKGDAGMLLTESIGFGVFDAVLEEEGIALRRENGWCISYKEYHNDSAIFDRMRQILRRFGGVRTRIWERVADCVNGEDGFEMVADIQQFAELLDRSETHNTTDTDAEWTDWALTKVAKGWFSGHVDSSTGWTTFANRLRAEGLLKNHPQSGPKKIRIRHSVFKRHGIEPPDQTPADSTLLGTTNPS